jgi:hypothetical protein
MVPDGGPRSGDTRYGAEVATRRSIPGRSALMGVHSDRRSNALKHAGFSATSVLPGESAAEFEKLHQALISEFRPNGALEEDTVASLAHLLWRKKNLVTFRLAELARQRATEIQEAVISGPDLYPPGSNGVSDFDATFAQKERAAEAEARKELKELYRLVEIGEEATIACLMKDLFTRDWTR